MEGYPKAIYMSAPWSDRDDNLENLLVRLLDERGFTVIGDHEDHKKGTTGRNLNWQVAVDEVMGGCHGVVAILHTQATPQTTSPYQFPELLAAARRGLPLLVVHQPGVDVAVEVEGGNQRSLVFGADRQRPGLRFTPCPPGDDSPLPTSDILSDDALQSARRLDLPPGAGFLHVLEHTELVETAALSSALDAFEADLASNQQRYVFNIIDFDKTAEHEIIARAVFEETGLPCYLATDLDDGHRDASEHWRRQLQNASMVFADLDDKNRNIVFEAGVAVGMNRPIRAMHRGKIGVLPFGLDKNLRRYRDTDELDRLVRDYCLPIKRTIFNYRLIDIEGTGEPRGLPEWILRPRRQPSGNNMLVSLGFLMAAAALFAITAYLFDTALLGVVAAAIAAAGAAFKFVIDLVPSVKDGLADHLRRRPTLLVRASIALFVISVATLIAMALAGTDGDDGLPEESASAVSVVSWRSRLRAIESGEPTRGPINRSHPRSVQE